MGEALSDHLESPHRRGTPSHDSYAGAAGGMACGDLVRVALRVEGDRVVEAGFDASGCAPARAAASAAAEMIEGEAVFQAARLTPAAVSDVLGGLSPPAR